MNRSSQGDVGRISASIAILLLNLFLSAGIATASDVVISEFVASNASGRVDEDGDTSDWIEIHNGNPEDANLEGWFLTDDPANLAKWRFPSTLIPAQQYLVVFASNKDRDKGELHTNFRLARAGGFLALVKPDGLTVAHSYPDYPAQHSDVAYGLPGQVRPATWVGTGASLRHPVPETDGPGADWFEHGHDDSGWIEGGNGIGYDTAGLGYEPLVLSPWTSAAGNIFARFRFDTPMHEQMTSLEVQYDDGFAAWLNGVRVASRNAPASLALNSLAVEAHQGAIALQPETVSMAEARHLLRGPLPEGVVASWDPVTITNGILRDSAGQHHGTLEGPVVADDPEHGPVMRFNGNDLAVIPSDPAFNLLDLSVSAWVHVTEGVNINDRLVSRDNIYGPLRINFALRTGWSNGGRPIFQVGQNPPAFLSVAESKARLRTGWHHLVGVRHAMDSVLIYVDGVLQGKGRDFIAGAVSNDAPVTIGGYGYAQERGLFFRGLVDEVQIYNRALSGEEIARMHAAGGIRHRHAQTDNVLALQGLNHIPEDGGMLLRAALRASEPGLDAGLPPGYMLPTPYGPNGGTFPGVAARPQLSHGDGVYGSSVTLSLAPLEAGSVVRYTLDGTVPDETSPLLDGTLTIDPPVTLRVRTFSPGWLPSPVVDFHYLDAPIRINEFLAVNTSINPDNVDLEDYSDWVELHNTSSHAVDLSGYHLSDDPEEPRKWRFPAGTMIAGNAMMLVWTDGHDAAPGFLVQRDYSPYSVDRLQRLHADFKLSGDGESILLHTPGGALLDRVDFGPQRADVSMGRAPDAGETWLLFGEPTPGAPNTSAGVREQVVAPAVDFSIVGGRYGSPQELVLSVADPEAEIRYTIDSTRPHSTSPLYQGPLLIATSTVVRARSFEAGHLPGKERVEVYLFDTNSTLPVVSLAAYPDTLYDPMIGIFTNAFKKRDMPVHVDFYEAGGEGEFHIDAGMRLIGFVILYGPQKSLSISLDNRWGPEQLDYALFPDRDYRDYTSFILRPGGQDGDVSFLREGLVTTVLKDQMDVDYQAYRPARVYLNGEYHGLYNIREKQDLDYLRSNHPGVGGKEIDFIEHDVIPSVVLDGDAEDYEGLVRYLETNDLAEPTHYEHVRSQIDINEYLNFQIASLYMGRRSTDHNIKFWKTQPSGRWRWLVFDVDQMWIYPQSNTLAYVTSPVGLERSPLWSTIEFRSLLENASFREEFIHRFVTHIHTTFAPARVHGILEEIKSAIDPEMPLQIARWPTRIESLEIWEGNVEVLREFNDERPALQMAHLKEKFDLGDQSLLSVAFDDTAGNVLVHGVVVEPGFAGEYFDGIPVKLKAVPSIGQRFAGWEGVSQAGSETEIALDPAGGIALTARFEPDPDIRIVPGIIDADLTLTGDTGPWAARGDVHVTPGTRLALEPGATLLMPDKASLYLQGTLEALGTAEAPVTIAANPSAGARLPLYPANEPAWSSGRDHRWGALVLDHPEAPVQLRHLHLSGASQDGRNPAHVGGITAVNADLTMEHLLLDNVRQPILTLGGRVVLRDSTIRITVTGDGINIKGAEFASVENCEFTGGTSFDTDAIDYDQIVSGQIVSNRIRGFFGFNSDGIDLGEGSKDILIEANSIGDCADKGVSVGQASTAILRRNLIFNCDQGVAVKDTGSFAYVDHGTFFDNRVAVAAFEKNLGRGGGIVQAVNSILAYSREEAVFSDDLSLALVDYCLANTESLPGRNNLFDGPEFVSPSRLDFRLKPSSSAIDAASPSSPPDPDGSPADLGAIPYAPLSNVVFGASLVITEVHYNPSAAQGSDDDFEFVELYNPNPWPVTLEGYAFVSGIQFTFPAGSIIEPFQYILLAKNRQTYEGNGYPVYQWASGNLANEGEILVLVDPEGYAVDLVQFDDDAPWPTEPDGAGPSLMLADLGRANAAAWNWRAGAGFGGTPGRANWVWNGTIRHLPKGRVELTWGGQPGVMYQLEYRRLLDAGDWMPVGEAVAAEGDRIRFVDDLSRPSMEPAGSGFYRLRVLFP